MDSLVLFNLRPHKAHITLTQTGLWTNPISRMQQTCLDTGFVYTLITPTMSDKEERVNTRPAPALLIWLPAASSMTAWSKDILTNFGLTYDAIGFSLVVAQSLLVSVLYALTAIHTCYHFTNNVANIVNLNY